MTNELSSGPAEAVWEAAWDKGVEFDGDSEVFEEYDATGDGDYGVEGF